MVGLPANDGSRRGPKRFEISGNWRERSHPAPPSDTIDSIGTDKSALQARYNTRGEDDPHTTQPTTEGTLLYIGNLPYSAKSEDVLRLLEKGYQVIQFKMSIDPNTGGNRSYYFVELGSKDQVHRAIKELNGKDVLGRSIKIAPARPGLTGLRYRQEYQQFGPTNRLPKPAFDRWTGKDTTNCQTEDRKQGRRLWVGGLPRMGSHQRVNDEVRSLFKGFQVEAVSKYVVPLSPASGDAAICNDRWLFADFKTAEDADRAAQATNCTRAWGVKICVVPAKAIGPREIGDRETWRVNGPLIASIPD